MPGKPTIPTDVTMLRVVNGVAFILPFGDDSFFSHVNFDGPLIEAHPELGPCWLWTGMLTRWGYGYCRVPLTRKNAFAHRYAWEQTNGQITGGLLVCHHCDRPACVNPIHLWLGTNLDNSRDKHAKGRAVNPVPLRGDAHHFRRHPEMVPRGSQKKNTTLTEETVLHILQAYDTENVTQRDLAARFGTSERAVWKIVNRKTWRHVQWADS